MPEKPDVLMAMQIRNRDGSAYLLALVAMITGLILALALLRASNGCFLAQSSREDKDAATYVAEAGVDYAAWQTDQNRHSIPYTADVTLSTGSFHVTVSNEGGMDIGTALVTSTATSRGCTYTAARVIEVSQTQLPYDYALSLNSTLNPGQPMICTGDSPGICVNGDAKLNNSGNNITAGVWASGSISGGGTITPQNPNQQTLDFPNIDYVKYALVANQTYVGAKSFGTINSATPQLIYVTGNVTLSGGTYTGLTTIVATGSIQINGRESPATGSDFLALITTVSVAHKKTLADMDSITYCHNAGNNATLTVGNTGHANVGSLCADKVSLPGGTLTVTRDPNLTRDIMTQMKLPGTNF